MIVMMNIQFVENGHILSVVDETVNEVSGITLVEEKSFVGPDTDSLLHKIRVLLEHDEQPEDNEFNFQYLASSD